MRLSRPFYFGCHERVGHYWWCRGDAGNLVQAHGSAPTHLDGIIDGGLCPPGGLQAEGLVNVVWLNFDNVPGTVLAFWDRSVDGRGNSNSNLVLPGLLDFTSALARARAAFPEVFARLKFTLVKWTPYP